MSDTIKGLFFDLDGTLVDTLHANVASYRKAIESLGRSITDKQLIDAFGMRYDTFLKQFYPDMSDQEMNTIRQRKTEYYPGFLHLSKPNFELIDFVRTLRRDHITVLVTMAQRANAMAVLEASKITDLLDFIITGDDIEHAKPHPESYNKALELSRLRPDQAIAFEDSESGISAARAAGITTLKISIINS